MPLPDLNRTLWRPDRLGAVIGTIGEGEEWDYDWGRDHRGAWRWVLTGEYDPAH